MRIVAWFLVALLAGGCVYSCASIGPYYDGKTTIICMLIWALVAGSRK